MRSYEELILLPTLEQRFEYLVLHGKVSEETFGFERYLNQYFYSTREWRQFRRDVILRDNGCEMGLDGYPIGGSIYIHHLNPITPYDIHVGSPMLLDMNNVVCVSYDMHQAIHYRGSDFLKRYTIQDRSPNDTSPWRI